MRHSTSRSLYRYWNEVRGDRIAPHRFEIEPSQIPELLPETFILETVDDDHLRYRLAGTRLADQFGQDFRGANFFALWDGRDRTAIIKKLATVTECGAAAVIVTEASCRRGRKAIFEFVVLPLIHTSGNIDRLLGAASCANLPEWIGDEPLVRQRLIDARIVVPEIETSTPTPVRPFAVVETQNPPPFLAHVRNARIVRKDRRQFRVYDGGLLTRSREL